MKQHFLSRLGVFAAGHICSHGDGFRFRFLS